MCIEFSTQSPKFQQCLLEIQTSALCVQYCSHIVKGIDNNIKVLPEGIIKHIFSLRTCSVLKGLNKST
jgi:hypothetical protein